MVATQLAFAAAVAAMFLLSGTSAQLSPVSAPGPVGMGHSSPGAMAPTPDCMTNLLNLTDCLSYVTAGSKTAKPDPNCCPELAGLVDSSPQCLCYLLDKNATSSYGINIDLDRALKLPSVCGVPTPPISLCSAITGAPVEAPNLSPGMAPDGVAASPSTGNKDAGGATSISVSAPALVVAVSVSLLSFVCF